MGWTEASAEAARLLEGVSRGRVSASEPGVEWAYLDWGAPGDDREVMTLLHANGFCAATLAPVAAALRDRFRVVAFDVRGHGDSTRVPAEGDTGAGTAAPGSIADSNYAWSRLADDYAAVVSESLRRLGVERVRYGIGHSFGGTLTLGAAARLPGCFEELLLLDPVILPPASPPGDASGEGNPHRGGRVMAEMSRKRRARFPGFAAAFEHFQGRGLFGRFRPEALALYVCEGLEESPGDSAEEGVRLKCDPAVEAAVFEAGPTIDPFEIAAEIDAPTRILHADGGNFSKAVYDAFAAKMPRAEVKSCAGGHLFPMETPETVWDELRA